MPEIKSNAKTLFIYKRYKRGAFNMLAITQGLNRASLNSMERLTFDEYDKDGDGVISFSEYNNYVAVSGINKVGNNKKAENKGFDVEQFDPQGSINFESNGGFNAKKLNILA